MTNSLHMEEYHIMFFSLHEMESNLCFSVWVNHSETQTHQVCPVTPPPDLNWTQTDIKHPIINLWRWSKWQSVLLTCSFSDDDWQVRWGTGDVIQMLKAGVQMSVGFERRCLSWPAGVNPVPSLSLKTRTELLLCIYQFNVRF